MTLRSLFTTLMTLPASIGPPETNTVGMFRRIAAISMPGVILSQFEMQTIASAQCALTMYSTESAIRSREGSEYSMPPWPIAMPSSTAMVLNSLATPPAASISRATSWPRSFRWTWPGHELGERVDDGNDRLVEVAVFHAGGAPEGTGACHIATLGRGV